MRKGTISLALSVLCAAAPAQADENEVRLRDDPVSYTDVIDAVDGEDPFDLNVRLGFRRSLLSGAIQRETASGSGRGDRAYEDIADYQELRNILELGIDVGLFRDLALYAELDLVLNDQRDLDLRDGTTQAEVRPRLTETTPVQVDGMASTEEQLLFDVPFDAATRSGVDAVRVGLAWSILNQFRRAAHPTLVLRAEGQFSLGPQMRPCSDDDRDDTGSLRCDPGVSRGTHALRVETRLSRRYRYVEPYGGLGVRIAWAGRAKDAFAAGGDLPGFVHTDPPLEGELVAGLAFVPWEHRGRHQRFTFDFRMTGTYVSQGRDYSPLYDALGTSSADYLTQPNLEGVPPAEGSAALRQVPFTGLTDVQAHGRFGGRFAVEMQAARYVRFVFGSYLQYVTRHVLTYTDACNPAVTPGDGDPRQGRCLDGIVDPHHRPAIDLPGNRFRWSRGLMLDLFATAQVQF